MEGKLNFLIILLVLLSVIGTTYFYFFVSNTSEILNEETKEELINQENTTEQKNQTEKENPQEEIKNITFQEVSINSSKWCNSKDSEFISSEVFGEGGATTKTLGTENITLGTNITNNTFLCEACHLTYTFSESGRKIDIWSNAKKISLLDGDIKNQECSRFIGSKTFLYSNYSANGSEVKLAFSNQTYLKEFWHNQGNKCLIINGLIKSNPNYCN